jgi:outer membrane receptor for ferrienterochelin and colicins
MRICIYFLLISGWVNSQNFFIYVLNGDRKPVPFAAYIFRDQNISGFTDSSGFIKAQLPPGTYSLIVSATGYEKKQFRITFPLKGNVGLFLKSEGQDLNEVVITGTLKEIGKDESPINIDIITPKLFQKTSTPNLFEATSLVNGVKPQINCNVCNTGDIHINGLEGPYTLILIDGMPIVSGLSSVYGLMGIPASMIGRLEIAKGPSGALYGSESMGGTINLVTKNPALAPKAYFDYYITSYEEQNLDLGLKLNLGKKATSLIGVNGYLYDKIHDINKDGFTDVTLQQRISLFNKVSFARKDEKEFSIAGRVVYEDRWGGETNWNKSFRGGDSIYGESIYAGRAELISKYQWPVKEKIFTQLSYNLHDQNSVYGITSFNARQSTAFAQTYWNRQIGPKNDLTAGVTYKNLWFDDNTIITRSLTGKNNPDISNTYGIFIQNETTLDTLSKHKLLLGARLDYNDVYSFIPSPRLAYKWNPIYKLIFRANFGTGFRIVNVFTEDHAALTGAREVVFLEKIKPEKSYNGSLGVVYKMKAAPAVMITWDAGIFYYHFTNKIYANYDSDPNKVIYDNLDGYAYSRGGSLNATLSGTGKFRFILGTTYVDVINVSADSGGTFVTSRQIQAPQWSGNIIAGYTLPGLFQLDITGNWYGPQRLPVLPKDFRPEYSPWFCLLNAQVSKTIQGKFELYGGVKNIFNFIPKDPIMRPEDPFDKNVMDASNPNGYTFDPSYNYAPIQSIRGYIGIRVTL